MSASLTALSKQSAPTLSQPIDSGVAEQFQVGRFSQASNLRRGALYRHHDLDAALILLPGHHSDLFDVPLDDGLSRHQVGDPARLPPPSHPSSHPPSHPVSRFPDVPGLAGTPFTRLQPSVCKFSISSRTNPPCTSLPLTLRPLTSNLNESPMAMTTTTASIPGSPPDLSGSRSSKSSSYCSTFDSDGPDTLATFDTNFEDITLDDVSLSPLHQIKQPPLAKPSLDSSQKATTPSQRPPNLPALQTQTREVAKDMELDVSAKNELRTELRTAPAHARRGFITPASPFLAAASLATRPRSSSPPKLGRNGRNGHPSSGLSVDTLRPNWTSRSSLPSTLRRGSYQSNRRSAQELEAEYHDSDDDLPDDASLWNVPVSPGPGNQSRRPSFRGSPGRASLATNPRPIPLQHPTPHPEAPSQRSPPGQRLPKRWRPPPPLRASSLNTSSFNLPSPRKDRSALPGRTRSWNMAISELSEEARILSDSLERHAESQRLSQLESSPLQSRTGPATVTPKPSSIQLPPVQRGNLDFMPISKEKEAILSRTRPPWLPPKDPREEKKHLKEYQQMMAASLEADKKKHEQVKIQQCQQRDTERSLNRIWHFYSSESTDLTQIDKRVFNLCWRGVSPSLRARVWQQAIGNELGLNAKSFHLALARARQIQSASEQGLLGRERTMNRWFTDIERDAETAFPELGVFQRNAPLWQDLIDVCKAYACYRADAGYVYGLQLIAALILLQTPSTVDAFVLLANAINRPAPLAFQGGDLATTTRIYNHAVDTLAIKFPRLHEYLFGSIESGGLGFTPAVIFEPMFKTLFCNGLDLDRLCRVWDIWVFDGDKTLVRTAVAILGGCLQSQIFSVAGDLDLKRRNIQEMLTWGPFNRTSPGQYWQFPADMDENRFVEEIRLAGRLDYRGK
ncbi:hypothetical protein DV737_g1843, partial [Chaetothyriales sp. CBS 132003]